jgi:hypothetical protein
MYVTNIIQQNFRPGASIHVSLPNDDSKAMKRHRNLNKSLQYSSDFDVANTLLEKLNEKNRWLVSGSSIDINDKNVLKQEAYLILVSSGQILDEDISDTINKLTDTSMWNSKAQFFVVITDCIRGSSEEIALDVLKELWEVFKVLNSVIVMPTVDKSLSPDDSGHVPVIDMYTWTPRQSEAQCMELAEVMLVDRWYWEVNNNLNNRSDLYANKLPPDFGGCPLLVGTALRNYHWVTNDKNESILKYVEPEMHFLDFVFKKLNLTLIHDTPEPINSNYVTSIINVMMRLLGGDTDLVIGEIPLMYNITQHADYTVSHFTHRGLWYVPCGRHESRVKTISRIFTVTVWIMITMFLFIASALMACMGAYLKRNKVPESHIFKNVTACLITLWAVTLGVSASELPRTSKIRIFFILFVWYSLAISTVFQTYFTSYLVDPGLKDRIKDFDGLLKSGIEFGYDPFFEVLTENSPDSRYQEAIKRRTACTDRNYCFGRVSITGDFAYMDIEQTKLIYTVSHRDALICSLDEGVINIVLTMYMKKGNVLIDKINHIVTTVVESGLYAKIIRGIYFDIVLSGVQNKWLRKTVNETLAASDDDEPMIHDDYVPLSLTHLHIAFYFIIIGYTLSFFVFMGEILAHKMNLFIAA